MQTKRVNILCTRAIDQKLVEKALEQNIFVSAIPFIKTTSVSQEQIKTTVSGLSNDNNIVFTSTNAVEAIAKNASDKCWKIYCTSGATYDAVKDKLKNCSVIAVAENAVALAKKILEDKAIEELNFLCGDIRMPALPELLKQHGVAVHEHIVYTTELIPRKIDEIYDGIIFFSPSAVESFFSVNTIDKKAVLFTIGSTTAEALKAYNNQIITSHAPNATVMMDTVIHFFKHGRVPVNS